MRDHVPQLPLEAEPILATIDQRLTHISQAEEARMRMVLDQSQTLFEGLQAVRMSSEINTEREFKKLHMIESSVMLDLSRAVQIRSEMESRAEQLWNVRLAQQQEEIQQQRLQQDSSYQEQLAAISGEVNKLGDLVLEQKKGRLQCAERVTTLLNDEFGKVHDAVLAEQKLRIEKEGSLLQAMEDMCMKIREDIHQQQQEREATQGKLLGLLEDACKRIEGNLSHGANLS